ncbi:alpha/beta hydrolase fold domain-containing protein [Nonomuraea sp. NPDC049129]|uniref:alpha/beta hydrolase n=1 Tax=Nonomuraea sp. NPDC049129 TaxID=3155272 RepID=UPI0033E5390F
MDDKLVLARGSWKYAAMGRMLRIMGAVAPRRVDRIMSNPRGTATPRFPDLLRLLEAAGGIMSPTAQYPAEFLSIPTQNVTIPGPDGVVRGRVYRPHTTPEAGLVWVHGGGFVGGDLDMTESHGVGLALAHQGVAVLTLDYRKALNGIHYPAPSDDVLAGWRWAVRNDERLGVDASKLHLAGASAGGNLVAGVTKRLRDTPGSRLPRTVVLAYPLLHSEALPWDDAEIDRIRTGAAGNFFEPQDLTDMAHNYAGRRSVLDDPYAFPPNGDLSGLPPFFIITAEYDSIRASGEHFARALRAAAGTAVLTMQSETAHGILAEPFSSKAAEALQLIRSWIAKPAA